MHRMGKSDNQRQNDRHYAEFRVDFEYYPRAVASGASRGTGKTVNLSLGGVYMLTDTMLDPDMPIALFFKMDDGNRGDRTFFVTNGTVLRAGTLREEPEDFREKFGLGSGEDDYYCAVKFTSVQFELSSMLAELRQCQ